MPKSSLFLYGFQCYHDTSQVTDELVRIILNPGLDDGAADVFLEFICYSEGPLPEELLPQVKVIHLCIYCSLLKAFSIETYHFQKLQMILYISASFF